MFGLGIWELVIVMVVVLVIFGPGRLPDLGSGLGEGIKNFKKGIRDAKALDVTDTEDKTPKKSDSEKNS